MSTMREQINAARYRAAAAKAAGHEYVGFDPATVLELCDLLAATEAANTKKDIRTKYADHFATIEGAQEFLRKIAELKFSEPAAKATGTAGEQCTCPSGDGSLRWPCPQHPPLPVAITDKTGPNGIKWYVEPNLPDGVNLYIKEQK